MGDAVFVNELLKICQIIVCRERSYLSVGPQYAMDFKQCRYDRLMVTLIDQGYRLTNWLMFLCGQIQSPRPDVMPDQMEGIARAEGFVSARIETSAS